MILFPRCAIVPKRAGNGQRFWDVVGPSGRVEYSSTLLPACEAFVAGFQRREEYDEPTKGASA